MKRLLKSLATFVFALVVLTLFELITSLIPFRRRPSPYTKTIVVIEDVLPVTISSYRRQNGTPPSSEEELGSWLRSRGGDPEPGRYDGWGNTIQIRRAQDTVVIISRGPDGLLNTGDEIVRVFTWEEAPGDGKFLLWRTYEGDL